MRHRVEGRKLNRTSSHRRALMSALITSLIRHKRIKTTTAKAKETRRFVEPIITRARDAYKREKEGGPVDVHARREVAKVIRDREVLRILFTEVAEAVGDRPGGYVRVVKLGRRLGDGAEMSIIELVDFNKGQDEKSRRRRVQRSKEAQDRRRKRSKEALAEKDETEEAVVDETVTEEQEKAPKPKKTSKKKTSAKKTGEKTSAKEKTESTGAESIEAENETAEKDAAKTEASKGTEATAEEKAESTNDQEKPKDTSPES
ncbi:MAG: 50S ribosomal protein L17 [Chlorobi bacterium]|nr:50S ribosomal protein L17 [Chlorobiota bacterium]